MNRAGMTLVELVVGLAVVGVVMAAGYAAFQTVLDRRAEADRATEALVRAATTRRTLVSWLSGARLTVDDGTEFRGMDALAAGGGRLPDDELTFLTTAATPLGEGGTVVRLHVDRDESTPEQGLVAELSEWRGTRTLRVEVEPAVTGLDLRYLSGVQAEREWLPSWISASVLPLAVRMELVSADSLAPLLRLPLLVPLGGAR